VKVVTQQSYTPHYLYIWSAIEEEGTQGQGMKKKKKGKKDEKEGKKLPLVEAAELFSNISQCPFIP